MPIESPRLDDLQYQAVVDKLRRQIPIYAREWTEHNDSDPGVTLIQLFGHLAEQIGYRLNRVPDKNYIEFLKLIGIRLRPAEAASTVLSFMLAVPETTTAFSIPRGSRVKGTPVDAEPQTFETDRDVDAVPAQLAALVTTRSHELRDITQPPSPTDPAQAVVNSDDAASYVPPRFSLAWDGKTPKLKDMPGQPVPLFYRDTEATHRHLWIGLAFNPSRSAGFLGQRVTLTLQLDDDEQPSSTAVVDCDAAEVELVDAAASDQPLVRYTYYRPAQLGQPSGSWLPVEPLADTTDGWTRSGRLSFDVPKTIGPVPDGEWEDARGEYQKTTADICAEASGTPTVPPKPIPHPLVGALKHPVIGAPSKVPISGWIHVEFVSVVPALSLRALTFNAAAATNAETVVGELVGFGDGLPGQTFELAHTNVLADSVELEVVDATDGLLHRWEQVSDFDASGPDARVYVLDPEAGVITCGDGIRGFPPELGAPPDSVRVVARQYRHGGGQAAELAVGTINAPESLPSVISDVTNIVAARGGKDAETLDEAKLRAPRTMQASGRARAVTAADFQLFAEQTPGVRVARAQVVPLRAPYPLTSPRAPGLDLEMRVPGVVSIVVVPDEDGAYPTPTEGMLRTVCRYLDGVRLVTTEVFIVAPQYVRLFNLDVEVRADAGYGRTALREAIADRLESYFHVLRGGLDGEGFPFGATVHHADLVARIFGVEGVNRVESVVAWYDGSSPPGAQPEMSWRPERAQPRRLVNCQTTAEDDQQIVLAADENIFVNASTLNVIVRA